MKNIRKAFTLVELLIVITIIGVLVSLIVPAISNAQKSTLEATTRTLLTNMATALTQYQADYGYFPEFLTVAPRINLAEGSNSENCVKALTGKDSDGNALTPEDRKALNRRARTYITFNTKNLIKPNAESPWRIVDSFENPNIYVCVDDDGDGFISQGFPTIADGLDADFCKELVPNPTKGVRSKVILFTLKKDSKSAKATAPSEDVFSWQ